MIIIACLMWALFLIGRMYLSGIWQDLWSSIDTKGAHIIEDPL